MLAEPVVQENGAGIDWYVEIDDQITQLTNLSSDVADYHRRRLQLDIDRIREAADAYETRGGSSGRIHANTLRVATTFPGEDCIWIAGDISSPTAPIIITGWGYEAYKAERGISEITKYAALPRTETAVVQPVTNDYPGEKTSVAMAWRWPLLGLLGLALLLASGFLLIPDCGLRMPGGSVLYGWRGENHCVAEAPTDIPIAIPRDVANEPPKDVARDFAQTALKKTGITQNDGETTVTLVWSNMNDLDIQARCPDGTLVKISASVCGAHVDYDDNGTGSGAYHLVKNPVEHLTWGSARMAKGKYTLYVEHYDNPASTARNETDFTVVLQRGTHYKEVKGRSKYSRRVEVTSFDVP
ncbi:hypothetical protein HFN89_01055 [Rhizobium laguerreae]|nr:hypothetical protein [Rhizobium laguerreae]